MFIWPILVFAIAICIVVVVRLKGKNSQGKYAAAAQRFVAKKFPNINMNGMQCLEGWVKAGLTNRIPLLVLYNDEDLYMIPAMGIPLMYKLTQNEELEDIETIYLPMRSIERVEVANGGRQLLMQVKDNTMAVNFNEKNSFAEEQSEEVNRFLATMVERCK